MALEAAPSTSVYHIQAVWQQDRMTPTYPNTGTNKSKYIKIIKGFPIDGGSLTANMKPLEPLINLGSHPSVPAQPASYSAAEFITKSAPFWWGKIQTPSAPAAVLCWWTHDSCAREHTRTAITSMHALLANEQMAAIMLDVRHVWLDGGQAKLKKTWKKGRCNWFLLELRQETDKRDM